MRPLKEITHQIGLALIASAYCFCCSVVFAGETSDSKNYCTMQDMVLHDAHEQATVVPDYSCLVGFADIADSLSDYQLIDARNIDTAPLPGSWKMSPSELRHKTFLKSNPLLIVNNDFGLAEMAWDCAVLLDAGFMVKFAAGSGWHDYFSIPKNKKIPAKDIFKEYHYGKLVLIAISETVSLKLDSIGLVEHFSVESLVDPEISNLALNHTENGMVPVVLVGDHEETVDVSALHFPNVFSAENGINALGIYFRNMKLSHAGKRDRQSRRVCGKI